MDISKEEKKAISIVENIKFKKYKIYIAIEMKDEIRFYQTEEERKAIDIVLNLIEKLQEENEELREITNGYNSLKKDSETFGRIPLIIADEKYFNDGIFMENYINKDKIRELVEEHNIELGEDTISMSVQDAFAFMLSIKELLEKEGE